MNILASGMQPPATVLRNPVVGCPQPTAFTLNSIGTPLVLATLPFVFLMCTLWFRSSKSIYSGSRKGGAGGGGWVHLKGANSMAMSGLGCRKPSVGIARSLVLFGTNDLPSNLVGHPVQGLFFS